MAGCCVINVFSHIYKEYRRSSQCYLILILTHVMQVMDGVRTWAYEIDSTGLIWSWDVNTCTIRYRNFKMCKSKRLQPPRIEDILGFNEFVLCANLSSYSLYCCWPLKLYYVMAQVLREIRDFFNIVRSLFCNLVVLVYRPNSDLIFKYKCHWICENRELYLCYFYVIKFYLPVKEPLYM